MTDTLLAPATDTSKVAPLNPTTHPRRTAAAPPAS
jgi:hypothetical protein